MSSVQMTSINQQAQLSSSRGADFRRRLVGVSLPGMIASFLFLPLALAEQTPTAALAVIKGASGGTVSGTVKFATSPTGTAVVVDLRNLDKTQHAMHIHEFGDCSSPDAQSAGDHFNPTGHKHGAPDAEQRHVGDLGNVDQKDNGIGSKSFVDPQIALSGANSIIGRSVVIHEKADDFKTDPSGNAGARIGCGVIGIARP